MAVTTLVQYEAQIWAKSAKHADPQSATIARFSQPTRILAGLKIPQEISWGT